jgi:glycosyltransferase involved in cell wall biosynthesis
MPRVLAASDIVVCPSAKPESFGMVVAEAMAAGRAVVASRAGGPAELVEDGVSGLLFPPGSAAALVSCLRRLAGDEGIRAALGRAARERILGGWSRPASAARLADVLAGGGREG